MFGNLSRVVDVDLNVFAANVLRISDTINKQPGFSSRNQNNKDFDISMHSKSNFGGKTVWIQYQKKRRGEVFENIGNLRGPFLFIVQVNRQTNQFIKKLVRVNDIFEYTSKHFMIRDTAHPIFAAGEMMIEENNVFFNLLSGTYQMYISQALLNIYTQPQIINAYQKALSFIFGRPVTYINQDLVTPILKRVRLSNLDAAKIKYQDVPISATKWLKKIVMSSTKWPKDLLIKRKVGKSSMYGAVFRLSNPEYLVKISLVPLRQDGNLNTNSVAREFKILQNRREAEQGFVVTADMTTESKSQLSKIFRGATGNKLGLYVIIMKDFFYDKADESGDLFDFFRRHKNDYNLKKEMLEKFLAAARELRSGGITHGDLHLGNVLYKIINDKIHVKIIDYGMSYIGPNKSGPPNRTNVFKNLYGRNHTRPVYKNNSGVSRIIPNKFYTNRFIKGMFSNQELVRLNYNKYKENKKTNNPAYERMKLIEAILANPTANMNKLLRNSQLTNTKKQILRNIMKNKVKK